MDEELLAAARLAQERLIEAHRQATSPARLVRHPPGRQRAGEGQL
jgi:hypothetical protein